MLKQLFPKAELNAAAKKPYAPENLNLLRRMLALCDMARIAESDYDAEDWYDSLAEAMHADSGFAQDGNSGF